MAGAWRGTQSSLSPSQSVLNGLHQCVIPITRSSQAPQQDKLYFMALQQIFFLSASTWINFFLLSAWYHGLNVGLFLHVICLTNWSSPFFGGGGLFGFSHTGWLKNDACMNACRRFFPSKLLLYATNYICTFNTKSSMKIHNSYSCKTTLILKYYFFSFFSFFLRKTSPCVYCILLLESLLAHTICNTTKTTLEKKDLIIVLQGWPFIWSSPFQTITRYGWGENDLPQVGFLAFFLPLFSSPFVYVC